MMDLMEPELYVLDVLLSELVKQVKVGCVERGQLLETCRVRFMELFATTAVALSKMSRFVEEEKQRANDLRDSVAPLHAENSAAKERIAALESENGQLREEMASLERVLEEYRQKEARWNEMQALNDQAREQVCAC
jgi:predicted nuclease with TOPRIM domain